MLINKFTFVLFIIYLFLDLYLKHDSKHKNIIQFIPYRSFIDNDK